MKRSFLLTLGSILLLAYGAGTQADEECIFTSPEDPSPLEVLDGAIYYNSQSFGYVLVFPPSSELHYAAERNEEDPDECGLAWAWITLAPYYLDVDQNLIFDLDITAEADGQTDWLPWPCAYIGVCWAFGASAVAAYPLDIQDFDVAYYFTQYAFLTIAYW